MEHAPTKSKLACVTACAGSLLFAGIAIANRPMDAMDDRHAAVALMKDALSSLDEPSRERSQGLSHYRDALESAERHLQRAVARYPVDSIALARLAAVRWELDEVSADVEISVVPLLDVAARRAPRNPQVQLDLGGLLYRMGNPDEAARYLSRGVTLSPAMTNRVVKSMLDAGLTPIEASGALPDTERVLIALKNPSVSGGYGDWYLARVERRVADASAELLATYGEACLQLGQASRLRDVLAELPATTDTDRIAERACQAAHAWLSLGDATRALALTETARGARANNARLEEFYGEVLLLAGKAGEAEAAQRRALGLVLAEGADPIRRARLYEALGRSLEHQGRPEAAYDSFRRAVALDPGATTAAARLSAYERGAGSVR